MYLLALCQKIALNIKQRGAGALKDLRGIVKQNALLRMTGHLVLVAIPHKKNMIMSLPTGVNKQYHLQISSSMIFFYLE